jgi:hypothetical protein
MSALFSLDQGLRKGVHSSQALRTYSDFPCTFGHSGDVLQAGSGKESGARKGESMGRLRSVRRRDTAATTKVLAKSEGSWASAKAAGDERHG